MQSRSYKPKKHPSEGQSTENRLLRLLGGRCPVHGLAFKRVKFPTPQSHTSHPHSSYYQEYNAIQLMCPRKDCDVCATVCVKDAPESDFQLLSQAYHLYYQSHFKNNIDTSSQDQERLKILREKLIFHLDYSHQYLLDEASDYRFGDFDYRAQNMRFIYRGNPIYKIKNVWFFHIKAQNHLLNFIKEIPFILTGDYNEMVSLSGRRDLVQETYYAFDPISGMAQDVVKESISESDYDFLYKYYHRSLYELPPTVDVKRPENQFVDVPNGMPRDDYMELVERLRIFYQTDISVVLEYLVATALERNVVEVLYTSLHDKIAKYIKSTYPPDIWYKYIQSMKM